MATPEKPVPGHTREKLEEAKLIVRAAQIDETERRLRDLESRLQTREDNAIKGHSQLITWIFSGMSFVVGATVLSVTILSSVSTSRVREDAKEMEQKVKDEIVQADSRIDKEMGEFEKKFEALAGEALKKPLIAISLTNGLLDGKVLEAGNYTRFPVYPIFLRNEGNKQSEPISMRLYCSGGIFDPGGMWRGVLSNDKDYPSSYYLGLDSRTMERGIAPKETWSLEDDGMNVHFQTTNVVNCKLLVFYGAETPAEAKFILKMK